MSIESVRRDILEIERVHRTDDDGGYKLASALCRYREGLPTDAFRHWDEVLLELVRTEAKTFWGVALEALARAGGPNVDASLSAMLRESGRQAEWKEYVAHTLIRRGTVDEVVRAEVERSSRQMSPMGLPNVAAVLVIAPEMLATAIDCIDAAMSSACFDYIEANVPPFVYAAADSDPALLVRLVQQTHARNHDHGKRLSTMILDYLSKPFVQKRFGPGLAAQVASELRNVVMN